MPLAMFLRPRFALFSAFTLLPLALAGCGVAGNSAAAHTAVTRTIQGRVHGGAYPIQGATVRLMETQSNGYGGHAKLLLPPVTTDSGGFFTFPSANFSCDSNQFAYLTVTSGTTANLGTTTLNNNVVQLAAVSSCAQLATDFSTVNVFLSEVSTVAAAAALGNFISIDSTNAGTGQQVINISAPAGNNAANPACSGGNGMTCTAAGLPHAFTNAENLVDAVTFDGNFPSGTARSAVPSNAASAVPAQLLNTLGNILQNCVDSVGGGVAGDGSYCGTLFTLATPPVAGAQAPTNTLQAAINMVKYPTTSVSGLFALQSRTPYFTPSLSGAPTSFAVSIFYGAEAQAGGYVPYPIDLTLDAADNVYVLYSNASILNGVYTPATASGVLGIGADGTPLFNGQLNSTILFPSQIAVNSAGRLFVTNNDTTTLLNGGLFATAPGNSSGTLYQIATISNPSGVALDRNDDVWISAANTTGHSILEYSRSAVSNVTNTLLASADFASTNFGVPVTSVALDSGQNVWGVSAGSGNSYAVVVPNSGTPLAPVFGLLGLGGGVKQSLGNTGGYGLALNSSSLAYFPTAQQLSAASFGGGGLSVSSGVATIAGSGAPQRTEVDGAGSIYWADNENSGLLYQFTPSAGKGALTGGTLAALLPCYPYPSGSGSACVTTTNSSPVFTPSNLRSLAIDSSGDIWYAADAGVGTVVETLGLAAPTWPQLSYGHPGCTPGLTTAAPACP